MSLSFRAVFTLATCFAEASMVVLSFDDNTPYKSWQTAEVMEEFLLSDIMGFPEIYLVERSTVKEAIIAEQSLNGSNAEIKLLLGTLDAILVSPVMKFLGQK